VGEGVPARKRQVTDLPPPLPIDSLAAGALLGTAGAQAAEQPKDKLTADETEAVNSRPSSPGLE